LDPTTIKTTRPAQVAMRSRKYNIVSFVLGIL
jgi:hypothetical protein